MEYGTAAVSTLEAKSQAYDNFDADVRQAIAHFHKPNTNQKERYINFLEKVFQDSAWAKSGTGVKGKNIPFNKEEV